MGEFSMISDSRIGTMNITLVAQTSKSAVSRVSKPAGRATLNDLPIWKSAIQQVWKPALRCRSSWKGKFEGPQLSPLQVFSHRCATGVDLQFLVDAANVTANGVDA